MAASSSERDLNPTVEDYDSDQSEYPVLESFRRSPAANVAAKRLNPSDLGTDKPLAEKEKVVPIDLRSDSGYSSHTAGTMSSADSAPSAKMSQASTAPSSAASMPPPPAASKRRTTVGEERRKGSESPRKPLQRNNSVSSKRPGGTRRPTITQQSDECRDPNCTTCGPNAPPQRRGRRESTALDSGLDFSYAPSDVRSQRSDPAQPTYTTPSSPIYNRQPAPYIQGSTMVQPAVTRPRASSTARRPMSYHGTPAPEYYAQGAYPSPPQDYPHGPPPSMSAHYGMPHHQQHPQMSPYMMGATPPQFYQGAHLMAQHFAQQTSPPYEQQRPPLAARNSSSYQARRPVSQLGPSISYDGKSDQPLPSARYGTAPQSARQSHFPPAKQLTQTPYQDMESSEYESSEDDEPLPVPVAPPPKQLMPPPKLKKSKKEARPVLRHANTTQVTQVYDRHDRQERRERRPSVSQSQTLPVRPREKDSRAPRVSTAPPSRSISVSRPKPRGTQSAYETPRQRVIVENARTSRRQSYQSYVPTSSRAYEQEYSDDDDDDDDYDSQEEEEDRRRYEAELRQEERRRRRRSTVQQDATTKVMDDVEAYQARTRGTNEPLIEHTYKAAKASGSRVPTDPDRKTRISQSARTTVTNGNNNGEIRLRVDASAPLNLSFNGDMEGRTLQFHPGEDGMAEIVIGGQRGEGSTYRSERGSVRGNRNSMIAGSARRDAEEDSVKSGRSSQGRREREESRRERDRDPERRPLRRSTQTRYHY